MPTVSADHAYVTGGDDIVDVLEAVLQDADDLVTEVTWDLATAQRDRMRGQAASHPRWASMAHAIDMWGSEEGIHYGVRDPLLRQQASEAEYGDASNDPAPLIRMGLRSQVVEMGWSMRQAFQESGY